MSFSHQDSARYLIVRIVISILPGISVRDVHEGELPKDTTSNTNTIQNVYFIGHRPVQNYTKYKLVHGHSHHSVHFGINSRNLAQELFIIHFVIFFGGGQQPSFIRGLICINSKWPPYDLPIITLCPITSEQIKIDT